MWPTKEIQSHAPLAIQQGKSNVTVTDRGGSEFVEKAALDAFTRIQVAPCRERKR